MEISKDLNMGNSSSLLQGDEKFQSRVLARDTSKGAGFSSRIYYRTDEGVVPFNWESKPGQPINPPNSGPLPPLSPPPAMHSSTLPQIQIAANQSKGLTNWSKVMFWRGGNKEQYPCSPRQKSIGRRMRNREAGHNNSNREITSGSTDRPDNFEFWSSDCDTTSSHYESTRFSSSSSFSFECSPSSATTKGSPSNNKRATMNSGRTAGADRNHDWAAYSCSPWNFAGGLLVCIPKRM